MAERQARHVVHAVDLLDAEAVHHPVLDHGAAAGAALLRRLEDEHRRAGEAARLGQVARRAEQHGGVPVMAAGMHLAGRLRGPGLAALLVDRQRVHVGAQADDAPASRSPAPFSTPTTPVRPMPSTTSSQPKRAQLRRHVGRRAVHVVEQLRMAVEVAPPGGDLVVQVGEAVDDRHRVLRNRAESMPARRAEPAATRASRYTFAPAQRAPAWHDLGEFRATGCRFGRKCAIRPSGPE